MKTLTYNPKYINVNYSQDKTIDAMIGAFAKSRREQEKRDANFIAESSINPIQVVSNDLSDMQTKTINQFNEKWAQKYKASKGKLSVDQRMEMNRDKNEMQSWQQGVQAGMDEMSRAQQLIQRDADGAYDVDKFNVAAEQFRRTGITPEGGFIGYTPISPEEFFGKNRLRGEAYSSEEFKDNREIRTSFVGGTGSTFEEQDISSFKSARDKINYELIQPTTTGQRLREGAKIEFTEEVINNPTKMKTFLDDFDANENGVLDKAEQKNAIVEFMAEKYVDAVRGKKVYSEYVKPTQAGKGLTLAFGQGRDKKSSFAYSKNVQSSFSGEGEGIEISAKSTFPVSSKNIKDAQGVAVEGLPTTANIKPLRFRDGKLEVEVTYTPKEKKGELETFSLLDTGKAKKTTETFYIDYDKVSSKLKQEYPGIDTLIDKYKLEKEEPKERIKIEW